MNNKKDAQNSWVYSTLRLAVLISMVCVFAAPAYADGFNMRVVNSLTKDGGLGMSDVEDLLGSPFETVEIAESNEGCVEGWMYTEVIMKGFTVKAIQVLTVFFDEDGYVCSTFITDGDKLSETTDRK